MATLYRQAGGFDRILSLVRRWHALCLEDPIARHSCEGRLHSRRDERLATYLSEALAGPVLYTAGYDDESSMQRIHAGNGEHEELDEGCCDAFDRALADSGITGETAARISTYFRNATIAQRAYRDSPDHVPDGLPFNHADAGR